MERFALSLFAGLRRSVRGGGLVVIATAALVTTSGCFEETSLIGLECTKNAECGEYSCIAGVCSNLQDRVRTREQIDELTHGVSKLGRRRGEFICECRDEDTSWNECMEGYEILPAFQRCIDDAYNVDQRASLLYLRCVQPLEAEFTECINLRLDCDDPEDIEVCLRDYDLGLDSCPMMSNSVERSISACVP